MSWLAYALISAAAAALSAILAKTGVEGVPSALATAIRTVVVVVCAWTVVLGLDQHRALSTISARSVTARRYPEWPRRYRGWPTFTHCVWRQRHG
jgi:transporter family protein